MLLMDFKEEDHHYVDSEAEEALSLCDLPLTDGGEGDHNWGTTLQSKENDLGRLSSDHQDFFGFFNDLNSEMNSAEDIIFCGKLLPYRSPDPPLSDHKSHKISKRSEDRFIHDFSENSSPHRRFDSQSELRNSTVKGRLMSNSNSLDYRKLQKTSSSKMTRTVSQKSEKDQISVRNAKPKWHLFLFGIMKTPTEMELRDIRSRQSKRNPSLLFPVLNGEQTVSVKRDGGKTSWNVFRALGCRGANAVVTASLGCLPPV